MDGEIFKLGLPDEVIETVLVKAAGKRFRFPPTESKHNPVYRNKRNKGICQKRQAGETVEKIANDTKLTARRIIQILKDNGITISEEKKKSRKAQLQEMIG